MVVHRDFFPDTVCQEAYGILVPRCDARYDHITALPVIMPQLARHLCIGRTVIHLPVFECVVGVVDLELLGKEILHKVDGQIVLYRNLRLGNQKALLELIAIASSPLIMITNDADGGINVVASINNLIR
ncbi:hypothetical protein D1872_248140 [compost metagenome]